MSEDKRRAAKNRTISLTPEQESEYLGRCVPAEGLAALPGAEGLVVFGDCFEALGRIPEKSVDLAIVDPPYNLDKVYGKSRFRRMGPREYEFFTRRWLEAVLPALKPTASLYCCCDWKISPAIAHVLADYLTVRNRITWQREKGRGALKNWKNSMEDIWFATVGASYIFNAEAVKQRRRVLAPYREKGEPKGWQETEGGNFRDTFASNFWDDISVPYWSMPENTDHPAQKPEKLFAKLVLASSGEGALVLDPFAGTGTACVVAKKLNRRFIGIEKEPAYCALAQKRLETAERDRLIQGYREGVFWERNTRTEQNRAATREKSKIPAQTKLKV